MTKVTYTGATAQKLKKPSYIVATLFLQKDTDNPTGDTYIFEDIERDTTSLSQDDNDTTTIDRETSDTPIDEVVTLGKWNVSAELDDIQDDLLVDLMGFFKDTSGNVCAPATYTDKYIQFDVAYKNGTDDSGNDKFIAMRVPKLKLNAKLVLESLNSDLGNITIAGTAQNIKVPVEGGKTKDTPFIKVNNWTLPVDESVDS